MVCFAAGLVATAQAQSYSPIVNDRVQEDVVAVPDVPAETELRGGLEIGAVLSAAYDSNIYLSRNRPVQDLVTRIGPVIGYTQGDAHEGEGGFIRFAYQPTGVIYTENGSENRIDHQALLTAGWRGKASSVTYSGAARKLGDATAETGEPTDRVELANEILAAWQPREKITVELAVGNQQSKYDDPGLYDSSETYGRAALRYAYSPKTEVGIAYQAGFLHVQGGSDQTVQQVAADIAWKPREKIRIALQAGAEHRDAGDGAEVNPVVEGRIEWEPRKDTKLYLAGYQRQDASSYYAGQNYSTLGVTAGVSQRLGGNWTGRLEVGREKVSYHRVSGSGGSGREDIIWFVRPSLGYKLTDALDVSLFYRISDDSSTARDFGYRQRLAGIELTYQF